MWNIETLSITIWIQTLFYFIVPRDVNNWLVRENYSARAGDLFKAEFIGSRMIALTVKWYFIEDAIKSLCKSMSKKQNAMSWERYLKILRGGLDGG